MPNHPPASLRYGLAVALGAAASVLRWLLLPLLAQTSMFLLVYPAALGTAVFWGSGPGVAAALAGVVGTRLLLGSWGPWWAELTVAAILLGSAAVVGRIPSFYQRRRSEERRLAAVEIERARHWLERVAETTPDIVFVLDIVRNRNVYTNRSLGTILGYTQEEFQSLPDVLAAGIVPEDLEEAARFYRGMATAAAGEVRVLTHRSPHRDGSVRWLEVRTSPFTWDRSGRLVEVIGIARDVTERELGDEALRRSVENVQALMDIAPVAIWVSEDSRARHIVGNRKANELLEAGSEENVSPFGTSARRYFHDGRELAPEELPMPRAAAEGREVRDSELEVLLPSGSRIVIWGAARPLRDAAGEVRGCVGAFMDISERKRVEKQLRELNATLEHRVRERTAEAEQRSAQLRALAAELTLAEERERRRLARLLHDHLQQLLVAARMRASVVQGQAGAPEVLEGLAQVQELLSQAIEASRAVTAELSPPVLYDAGLGAALDWLSRQMWDKHRLQVKLEGVDQADPLPEELRVFCFQAARELLLNVVKHSRSGRARVGVGRGPRRLRLEVRDYGRGLEAAAADVLPKGKAGGFGLLSIRERAELLGGRLRETGVRGRGARFILDLPLPRSADAAAETPEPAETPPPAQSAPSAPIVPDGAVRLLLVDDHPMLREGLALLLSRQRAKLELVGQAGDGIEALDLSRELRPDVVVMDVTMPRMGGIEATRRLAAELPEIKVIGLSMHAQEDLAQAMREAGAVAYLRKDGPIEELVAAILAAGA